MILVVKGENLPSGWKPGVPIPSGTKGKVIKEYDALCPIGPKCYACNKGAMWAPESGRHIGEEIVWNQRSIRSK